AGATGRVQDLPPGDRSQRGQHRGPVVMGVVRTVCGMLLKAQAHPVVGIPQLLTHADTMTQRDGIRPEPGHSLETPVYLREYRSGGWPSGRRAPAGARATRRVMTSKTGTRAAFCAWVRSMHAAHRLEFRRAGDPWLAPVPPRDRPPAERTDRGPAAGAGHPGPGRAGTDRGLCVSAE